MPNTKVQKIIDKLYQAIHNERAADFLFNVDSSKSIRQLFQAAIQSLKQQSIKTTLDPTKPWITYQPPLDLSRYIIPGTIDPSLNRNNYGLLHLALIQHMKLDIIKDLLSLGCDPNWFAGGVTPMGWAAYSGNLPLLRLMHQHGGDLLLEMTTAHTEDPDLIHSTLLHRVASRDIKNKIEILNYLWRNMPNPLCVTQSKKTAIAMANDEPSRTLLSQYAAKIESKILKKEVSRPLKALPIKPRL